jgi:hypothetical protein
MNMPPFTKKNLENGRKISATNLQRRKIDILKQIILTRRHKPSVSFHHMT